MVAKTKVVAYMYVQLQTVQVPVVHGSNNIVYVCH